MAWGGKVVCWTPLASAENKVFSSLGRSLYPPYSPRCIHHSSLEYMDEITLQSQAACTERGKREPIHPMPGGMVQVFMFTAGRRPGRVEKTRPHSSKLSGGHIEYSLLPLRQGEHLNAGKYLFRQAPECWGVGFTVAEDVESRATNLGVKGPQGLGFKTARFVWFSLPVLCLLHLPGHLMQRGQEAVGLDKTAGCLLSGAVWENTHFNLCYSSFPPRKPTAAPDYSKLCVGGLTCETSPAMLPHSPHQSCVLSPLWPWRLVPCLGEADGAGDSGSWQESHQASAHSQRAGNEGVFSSAHGSAPVYVLVWVSGSG